VWIISHSWGERRPAGRNCGSPFTLVSISISYFNHCSQDLDQEDDVPLRQVDYKPLDDYYRQDMAAKKQREEAKAKILYEQKGFCKEGGEGDGY